MALTKTLVSQLYVALFNRASESEGNKFWQQMASQEEAAAAMLETAPAQKFFDGMDDREFVAKLYEHMFTNVDSEENQEGIDFWANLITEHGHSRAFVVAEIVRVVQEATEGPGLDNKIAFDSRVSVSDFVADTLDSLPEDVESAEYETILGFGAGQGMNGMSIEDKDAILVQLEGYLPTVPVDPDVTGETRYLTAGQDVLEGTELDDVFVADVVQNMLGQQVNSFGSGDRLNGGEGNDTLEAQVTAGAYVNGAGTQSMPIQGRTESIENIKLEAVQSGINGVNTEVFVNAKDMVDVKYIGSERSDANLTIMNLTSKGNNHVSEMTVGMKYTGNADSQWEQSDLSVYFDQDYLTTQRLLSRPSVDIRVMNEEQYDQDPATPLNGVFFRTLNINVNGTQYDLAKYLDEDVKGNGDEISTYAELLSAIQEALVKLKAANPSDAALQTVRAEMGPDFKADRNPETLVLREGTAIRLSIDGITNGVDNELMINKTDLELARVEGELYPNNNRWEEADNNPPLEDSTLSITVDLEKAGLSGDGGRLTIGSMNKGNGSNSLTSGAVTHNNTVDGIQEFNVRVIGDKDKSSSLSALESTNNALEVVTVETVGGKSGDYADLTIGNQHTNWADGALRDVKTFDASAFKGNLTLFANLTTEIKDKYLAGPAFDQGRPADDNVKFQYTGGQGNDYIDIRIESENMLYMGHATREDWSLNIDGGKGNDTLVVSFDSDIAGNWYENQKMLQNVTVSGGEGNDTIYLDSTGDFIVDGGTGNDVVYAGASALGDQASWVFNAANGGAVNDDILSSENNVYNLYKTKLQVSFLGFESVVEVELPSDSVRASDLHINNAIKAAINNDPVLNKLLVALDGPGYTLAVESLIDGLRGAGDLTVSLIPPTVDELTAGDLTFLSGQIGGVAGVAADWAAYLAGQANRFNLNQVDNDGNGTYNREMTNSGQNSDWVVSDNIITGGEGNDVIVLGTGNGSNDTVKYVGFGNGTDSVVNFVAGNGNGYDALDFTSYGAVAVRGAYVAGPAVGADEKFLLITEVPTNAGEYKVELYLRNEDGSDDLLGHISNIDFGQTQNFTADNILWVAGQTLGGNAGVVVPPGPDAPVQVDGVDGGSHDFANGAFELVLDWNDLNAFGTGDFTAQNFGADDSITVVNAPAGFGPMYFENNPTSFDAFFQANFDGWLVNMENPEGVDIADLSALANAAGVITADDAHGLLDSVWGADWLNIA